MTSPLRPYDEAAAYLHISRAKLERLVRTSAITCRRIGSRVFFTQADLDAFIDAARVDATAAVATRPPAARRAARVGGPNLSVIGRR